MQRRTAAGIASSLLLTGTVLLLAWMIARQPGKHLNLENFTQIRPGMTQAEVERLLGGPPGNYGRYSEKGSERTLEGYRAPPGSVEKLWYNDAHRFEIYFAQEGRVVGLHKRGGYQQFSAPSWLERLRSWLGW
jgi:hypothetical protein